MNGRRVVLVDAIFASLVPVICGNLNIQNMYRTLGDFEEALSAAQGNLGSKIEIEVILLLFYLSALVDCLTYTCLFLSEQGSDPQRKEATL